MKDIYIDAFAIHFGEKQSTYRDIPNWESALSDFSLPPDPGLLGLGNFYSTDRAIGKLLLEAARASLQQSKCPAEEIELVYICSSEFGMDKSETIAFNQQLFDELGLQNAYPVGVTLAGCTTFLSTIDQVAKMMARDLCKNALILTADLVKESEKRLEKYALFSDSSGGCILTTERPTNTRYIDGFTFQKVNTYKEKNSSESAFYKEHFEELSRKTSPEEIKKYFCNNIYPIMFKYKEMRGGVSNDQLYFDNIDRFGHCFGVDPLFNYFSHIKKTQQKGRYALSSDAPPFLKCTLLLEHL